MLDQRKHSGGTVGLMQVNPKLATADSINIRTACIYRSDITAVDDCRKSTELILISSNPGKFEPLLKQVLRSLKGQRAILDGEIVVLSQKGRSNFYDLMAHRGEPRYYAFDLLWLNGIDLRSRPFLDRKRRLHRVNPLNDSHLLCVSTWMATERDSSSWRASRTWRELSKKCFSLDIQFKRTSRPCGLVRECRRHVQSHVRNP